jgi:hypothetical protein
MCCCVNVVSITRDALTGSCSFLLGVQGLPTGDQKPSDAFLKWQAYSKRTKVLPIGMLIERAVVNPLDAEGRPCSRLLLQAG